MLIIVATTSPDAHALSPCIPSDFALVYDDASTASLSDEQLVIVHAAVARMRECDIGQIEIFAASSRVAFWRQRAQALRTELIAATGDCFRSSILASA